MNAMILIITLHLLLLPNLKRFYGNLPSFVPSSPSTFCPGSCGHSACELPVPEQAPACWFREKGWQWAHEMLLRKPIDMISIWCSFRIGDFQRSSNFLGGKNALYEMETLHFPPWKQIAHIAARLFFSLYERFKGMSSYVISKQKLEPASNDAVKALQ